jgi:serine/threonine protein phosphatase PrpC
MKIISYSDPGSRKNNEDFTADGDFVFVLCDGVGGIAKGEVASRFAASSVVQKMQGVEQSEISELFIQHLITEVQNELTLYLTDHPDCFGMGTTLCAVFISENEVFVAHIGDSRVYFIKPDERKFWRTTDHSVVAELVHSGILKEKDAKDHYLSNQITRAIQAIPEMELAKSDITSLSNFRIGDLLFLCSDGVNEAIDDVELVQILCNTDLSAQSRLELIQNKCLRLSSDNNSAILLEFENEDQISSGSDDHLNWNILPEEISSDKPFLTPKSSKASQSVSDNWSSTSIEKRIIKIAIYTLIILFIALLTFTMIK